LDIAERLYSIISTATDISQPGKSTMDWPIGDRYTRKLL